MVLYRSYESMPVFGRTAVAGGMLFLFFICGCLPQKEIFFSGRTMGTTYRIKAVVGLLKSVSGLNDQIESRLGEINRSMSVFLEDSEISRFNAMNRAGENMRISEDFYSVLLVAGQLYKMTGGAWDGTVNPLVDLWGFGPTKKKKEMPSRAQIDALLSRVGFNKINILTDGRLEKKDPSVTLDLASIAKGFGVDAVSTLLKKNGVDNFLVEIGGEVYAAGMRKDHNLWRVGINTPLKDSPFDQVYKVVPLKNRALATSGDYRNFFEAGGKRYAHILDPRTGYPVRNRVVSVTVLAKTCTFADGLATALAVMGPEKGLELVDRLDEVECMIVVMENDGRLTDRYSKGFKRRMLAVQ